MKKVLGLDLGTNSIGWAVIDEDESCIEDAGVRIFQEGVVAKTIGTGDKEESRNATRRNSRQMRRQFYRKRLRKIKLLELLIHEQMCPLSIEELNAWKNWNPEKKSLMRTFPESPLFMEWIRLNPYDLRARALHEEVTDNELGRIFYHLIQRRGFLSSRKVDEKESKTIYEKGLPSSNILPINATKEKIKDSTLGEYLQTLTHKQNEPYQEPLSAGEDVRIRGRYTTRDMYVAEFDAIWKTQCQFKNLENRLVLSKRTRKLKGSIQSNRNVLRINYLKGKYGENNVVVEEQKGGILITTKQEIPFKEFLAGKIDTIENENGETTLKYKSNESVLFWQRPLRSQKGTLAPCQFEQDMPVITAKHEFLLDKKGNIQRRSKKPCPVSHPEFELFRAYQFVNNISYGRKMYLTTEQKELAVDVINTNKSAFKFSKIIAKLGLGYEKFNFEADFSVAPNVTIATLSPLFDQETWADHYEEIWHCFYFYEDNDKLYEKLCKSFGYTKSIDNLKKVKLKEDYGSVSLKAIRNILPFLKKGYSFDRAVILGGVKNAFGNRWDRFLDFQEEIEHAVISILREDNKEGEAILKIKKYLSAPENHYGFLENDPYFSYLYHHSQEVNISAGCSERLPLVESLRNPIVQQSVNEMRRLVNNIIKNLRHKYGDDFTFDRIHVEMGRDLRNGKKKREELSQQIKKNTTKNEEAVRRLNEYGLQPTRNNIQKYLMWKEIEEKAGVVRCPYTGKTLSISSVLGSENLIQIEHIIPYSISLNDSFGNKTLCEANFNREKGEKTPYEFYQSNPSPELWGVDSWEAVEERAFKLLPYIKAKTFTTKREFEKSTFIERQLNDSRYIAKKSVELLSHICKDVRVMPGQLTAELRHLWGLNNILQSTDVIDCEVPDLKDDLMCNCYAVRNDEGKIIRLAKVENERPMTLSNEILIPANVFKKQVKSKYFTLNINLPEDQSFENGEYWAKFQVSDDIRIYPKYMERPSSDEDHIIFRGQIQKKIFSHDTVGKVHTEQDDGSYWATFLIKDKKFIDTDMQREKPKSKPNQILLFGSIVNGLFKCYIYSCQTNINDGKYWLLLDIDRDNVDFLRSSYPQPMITENQICITAEIKDNTIETETDLNFNPHVENRSDGKYYAVLTILNDPILYPIKVCPPSLCENEKLVEGMIWIDKYTGEIKFDPKKNRDDHRHHAIDAITIALTKQSFLQRLSTYNADCGDKLRGKLNTTEKFPEPWAHFRMDVKKVIDGILVSIRKSNKTLTKNKKGFSVRGQLHKENVFGKRQSPLQSETYHRRIKITELKDMKQVGKIVDKSICELVRAHLVEKYGLKGEDEKIPADAFFNDGKWLLYLPNKKGDPVPVKKVRIGENLSNAVQLKLSVNQYVNPRNNHHVTIYEDNEGNLQEEVVQFWTAVQNKLDGLNIYQLPSDARRVICYLEVNDMYLLGMSDEEYSDNKNNYQFLSQHLYRVQKLSSMFYTFRHHLASTLDNKNAEVYIQSMKRWIELNPIKVRINEMGKIIQKDNA